MQPGHLVTGLLSFSLGMRRTANWPHYAALLLSRRDRGRLVGLRSGGIERAGDRALATCACVPHRHLKLAVGRVHRCVEIVGAGHRLAVEREDHVTRHEARLLGSAARHDADNHLALRAAVLTGIGHDAKFRPIVGRKAIVPLGADVSAASSVESVDAVIGGIVRLIAGGGDIGRVVDVGIATVAVITPAAPVVVAIAEAVADRCTAPETGTPATVMPAVVVMGIVVVVVIAMMMIAVVIVGMVGRVVVRGMIRMVVMAAVMPGMVATMMTAAVMSTAVPTALGEARLRCAGIQGERCHNGNRPNQSALCDHKDDSPEV